MGLNMCLSKRTYVKEKHQVIVKKGGKIREDIKPERIKEIVEEIGCWRKANHIHNFFIKECADGEDDCKESYVDIDELEELKRRCQDVITSLEKSGKKKIKVKSGWAGGKETFIDVEVFTDTSLAEKLLPTQSGFFFGGTDYDECYLETCKETIKIIDDCLKEKNANFYYQASW